MLAIFDLDGTLVDSLPQISICLNQARVSLGYEVAEFSFYKERLGLPIEFLISDLNLTAQNQLTLVRVFRQELLRSIYEENIIYPGVLEGLDLLESEGVELAIATSKPSHIARAVVENSPLNKYGFFIQGTDDARHKPDPHVLTLCINHFQSNQNIMIGDRREDIFAGVAAKCKSIGIAASAHSKEVLIEAGATLAISSFTELTNILVQCKSSGQFARQLWDYLS